MSSNKNVNNGTKPDSRKKAKPTKYGVGNLAVGPNRALLQVTVMTVPSPNKIDGTTLKYILKDETGSSQIVALACGETRLAINQILQVNASYQILPGGANAVEKRRNPKFKSEVRNSKTLYLNDPSKIIPLVQNHASKQNPGTSSIACPNNGSAPKMNLNNDLQNYSQELTKQKSQLIRTFTEVQILGGSVRRYIGCENCTKSIRSSQGGAYFCESKKCKNPKKPVNRKICYVIKDIKIKKLDTQFPFELVCFNGSAETILGKEAFQFGHDLEAQGLFDKNIVNNLYTLELKGKWEKGHQFPIIIIRTADPKAKAMTASTSTDGVNNVSGCTDSRIMSQPKNTKTDYLSMAANFKVSVVKDTSQRPRIGPNEQRYELNTTPPGHALIINNINFTDLPDHTRLGAEKDLVHMKDLLSQLNYKVQVEEDVKSTNLKSIIEDFQSKLKDGEVSSTFVVVMSHGKSNEIYLSDGIMVNAYSDIIYKFSTEVLPEFEGKPKIFVFQSCQNFGPTYANDTFKQMTLSDILVLWPNSPGFEAPRRTDVGSPFIIHFVKILMEQACNTELTKMCKNIQVAFRGGGPTENCLQYPYHIGILFSDFYFKMD